MTMTAPEHVHTWELGTPWPARARTADVRCACGVSWDEWLRETVG